MVRNTHDIVLDHFGVLDESQLPATIGTQAKVSSDDTTAGYLEDKIVAGSNVTINVLNDGGNEQLEIESTGGSGGGPDIGRTTSVIGNECFFIATSHVYDQGGITQSVSGTGAGTANASGEQNHPGIITLSTGTATNGRCAYIQNPANTSIRLGSGAVRFGATIMLPTLSDGTDTYTVRMGVGDILTTSDGPGNAVFFRYTHGTNSGKWEARTIRTVSAGSATTDTGITADTGWHTYEFEVNTAGSSVEFFIDGASVATITTFIPTASVIGLQPLCIQKSAGTTARNITADAYWYYFTLNR